MAINKVVNKSTKSHGALRNVLEYALRTEKIPDKYVAFIGPFDGDEITYDAVYQAFIKEKKLWDKDSGRMYAHNIISFHNDEIITPQQAEEIGRRFVEQFFPEYQNLITVHQDNHPHIHIITNSVSFINGSKLHQTKRDLEQQKRYTDELCYSMGLTLTRKGYHFDGSIIEKGNISSWSQDKYKMLADKSKPSFLMDCAMAVTDAVSESTCREDFINKMNSKGWVVQWEEKRKHIVFHDRNGNKVRDTNLSKTFNLDISKEALSYEFIRNNELAKYSSEAVSVITRFDNTTTIRGDSAITGIPGLDISRIDNVKSKWQRGRYRKDYEAPDGNLQVEKGSLRVQDKELRTFGEKQDGGTIHPGIEEEHFNGHRRSFSIKI